MLSTLPKTNLTFSVTHILLSANVFNLEQYKILLCGKGLIPRHAKLDNIGAKLWEREG